MTRILLSGCSGRMGRVVTASVAENDSCEIVGGIDVINDIKADFPVFSSPSAVTGEIIKKTDVIIDFSNQSAFDGLIEFAVKNSLPAVICTTGLDNTQKTYLKSASAKIPVFFSANMSIGVNLVTELAKKAAKILGNSFDIEIVEMHHNQKVDAPSGTALMMAEAIKSELDGNTKFEYDRHTKREKRPKNEIGIHSVRGGTVTGEHEIIFAGHDELIKISHSARSRELFATGAINAALFIAGKQPGMYDMSQLLNES